MHLKLKQSIFILVIIFLIASCGYDYTPKPSGYFRIDMPKKEYKKTKSSCPYTFSFPIYSKINFNKNKGTHCWFNLDFPAFNAQIHHTYKYNENRDSIVAYIEETRNLAYKHSIKADAINERLFIEPDKKVYGILYQITGNAASPIQYYLSDSTNHFIRGALYFNVTPNVDSLAPVIKFIEEDIVKLIESFEWKK